MTLVGKAHGKIQMRSILKINLPKDTPAEVPRKHLTLKV